MTDPDRLRDDLLHAIDFTYAYGVLGYPTPEELLTAYDRTRQTDAEAGHVYLSTSCLHGEHGYCSNVDGIAGLKKPAQCKFCAAPCVCPCHSATKEN
ncbi:hypothetical protein ACIQ9J_01605 [Streptomyces sp. NPDC094153]|uniref:hypothetical protein n=1 Tax=Streptomyces sp. NPDC094153 TaxID=3366058 RepID=UPI00380D2AE4